MVNPDFYIPVDPPMSLQALSKLSEKQLQTRALDDPKYAGYETKFDWHHYINVDMRSKSLHDRTVAALDAMAKTEEGQHSIRQAYAVRQFALKDEHYYSPIERNEPRILIQENPSKGSSSSRGRMRLDENEIDTVKALGKDGNYHAATVADVLFHELGHLKDPLVSLPVYQPFWKQHAEIVRKANELQDRKLIAQADPTLLASIDAVKKHPTSQQKDSFEKQLMTSLEHIPPAQRKTMMMAMFHAFYDNLAGEAASAASEYPVIADTNRYVVSTLHLPERALVHNRSEGDGFDEISSAIKKDVFITHAGSAPVKNSSHIEATVPMIPQPKKPQNQR